MGQRGKAVNGQGSSVEEEGRVWKPPIPNLKRVLELIVRDHTAITCIYHISMPMNFLTLVPLRQTHKIPCF